MKRFKKALIPTLLVIPGGLPVLAIIFICKLIYKLTYSAT